jgi:hypothetical protein
MLRPNTCSFDLFNQEVAFSEEQGEAHAKKWVEPHDTKESKAQTVECSNCVYVEPPQKVPASQGMVILKSEASVPLSIMVLLNEDVKMFNRSLDNPQVHKLTARTEDLPMSKVKSETMFEDVILQDKNHQVKWRSSPVYRSMSESQGPDLCMSPMTKEITVEAANVLGSSLELDKRLQIPSKTQPVSKVTYSKDLEVLINSAECGINPFDMAK